MGTVRIDHSLHNLASNPTYDFIKSFDEYNASDDNFDNNQYMSDSPYENSTFLSSYVDPLVFAQNFQKVENISIFSLNIQSLSSKFNDLHELITMFSINKCNPDIICLQELWQFPDLAVFSLPGYHPLVFKLRGQGVQGGGVGIFVKLNLKFKSMENFSIFSDRILESIFIKITLPNNSNITIGNIYRPGTAHPVLTPLEQYDSFSEIFTNMLSSLVVASTPLYIVGDFNIDLLKISTNARCSDFLDLLFSFGLLQIVTKPTRCTDNSATLIDHIITNQSHPTFSCHILTSKISDHFPIIHFLQTKKPTEKPKTLTARNFCTSNLDKFKANLTNINWNFINEEPDAQSSYNSFSDVFHNLYNMHFPLVTTKFNRNFHKIEPWITTGLLISRNNKLKLASQSAKYPTLTNVTEYKLYRNLYNKILRMSKKNFYDKKLGENTSNLKKTWDILRSVLNSGGSTKNPISELFSSGIHHTSSLTIANELNKFFTSAPAKIANELPPSTNPPKVFFNNPISFSFTESPVTASEILEATAQLMSKKSEDLNGVSMFLIKNCINILVTPLLHIITKSLVTGVVPSQLKIAKVVPIHKGGDKLSPDNYRPISLLPNFSKILEKVVSIRLISFLDEHKILSPDQFGFRKGHSTIHPLLLFVNDVTSALNKKENTISIFCDIRKAFDTVNHEILLAKLSNIGVRGVELEWFRSYLSNRMQFVSIDGACSGLLEILLGVPQGSILGPLLFLIFINDLPRYSSMLTKLFADDTTQSASHKDLGTLVTLVNDEFHKTVDFFISHRLSLHPNKTKFILFSNQRHEIAPKLVINFNPLIGPQDPTKIFDMEFVNNLPTPVVKFLGVLIDPQLSFKNHISTVVKKVSTSLFFLRKVKNVLNQKALKSIYYALFHSHLIYANQIWSCCSENLLKPLITKQKIAIRIISNVKYNAHTEPLFKCHKILPFAQLCLFFKIQFMQQFVQKFLPVSLHNIWITNAERHQDEAHVVLRNDDILNIPFARNSTTTKHPLTSFPKIWTEFPDEGIKFLRNKIEFNAKLKHHFLSNLNSVVVCGRLLCPDCHLRNLV